MVLTLRARGIDDVLQAPAWAILAALFGGYGPSIAALVLTGRRKGRKEVKALLARFKLWRASPWVHLVVWLGPSIFLATAMLMAPDATSRLGEPVWSRLKLVPLAFVAAIPFGPLGEELGWRGYALPRLQGRYSALSSSLMIGVAWTFWHTPLFWAPAGTTISGSPITIWAVGKYLITLMGLSVLYTWVFNNSRGSVALAVAFHATGNAVFPFLLFPDREAAAALFVEELSAVLVWIAAFTLLALYGAARLTRSPDASEFTIRE